MATGPYQPPPQGIGVGLELLVGLLLHGVDQEGGQDEAQEADVPGGDELLQRATAAVSGAQLKVIKCHPQRLSEREAEPPAAGDSHMASVANPALHKRPLFPTTHTHTHSLALSLSHTHTQLHIFRSLLARVHDSISKLIKAKVRQMFLRSERLKLDHRFEVVEEQTPATPSCWLPFSLGNRGIGKDRSVFLFLQKTY